MSPEFHETLDYLVESSYQAVQEIIAAGRGIPRVHVTEAIDHAFLSAADLKALGLVSAMTREFPSALSLWERALGSMAEPEKVT
jgi:ClpP class serine protease